MPSLTRADLQLFKQRLRERREQLRTHLRSALAPSRRDEYAYLVGETHDAGDESVSKLLRDTDLAGREREVRELRDVGTSLLRIADGSYGICTDCSADIGRDRLGAYPTAKRCLRCQRHYDVSRTAGVDVSPSL
ncbi:MAG: TraR/DksA C4-type zinc finger protein [Gammaproteobacteria bacterium]|nr:TraR/DksA C4-type zinc finger protein [Gammaproteobacteria bacterium]